MLPQIIVISIMVMNLGMYLVLDGKPKEGKYSFLLECVSFVLLMGLLYWGGFFDVFFK